MLFKSLKSEIVFYVSPKMASLMFEAFLLYYPYGYTSMVYLKQNVQHDAVSSPTYGWMISDVDLRLKNSIQWMVRQFVYMHALLN